METLSELSYSAWMLYFRYGLQLYKSILPQLVVCVFILGSTCLSAKKKIYIFTVFTLGFSTCLLKLSALVGFQKIVVHLCRGSSQAAGGDTLTWAWCILISLQ